MSFAMGFASPPLRTRPSGESHNLLPIRNSRLLPWWSAENSQDLVFLDDEVLGAVDVDLRARPLADQHLVSRLDRQRLALAVLEHASGADGDDVRLLGLLLRGVGHDDPADLLLLLLDPFHEAAVAERPYLRHALLASTA